MGIICKLHVTWSFLLGRVPPAWYVLGHALGCTSHAVPKTPPADWPMCITRPSCHDRSTAAKRCPSTRPSTRPSTLPSTHRRRRERDRQTCRTAESREASTGPICVGGPAVVVVVILQLLHSPVLILAPCRTARAGQRGRTGTGIVYSLLRTACLAGNRLLLQSHPSHNKPTNRANQVTTSTFYSDCSIHSDSTVIRSR